MYCSKPCAGLGKTKPRPIQHCLQCGQPFQRLAIQQFCTTQCAGRYRGQQRRALHDGPPAWKIRHQQFSRDFKLVQKAIRRGELSLPEGWRMDDAAVQAWVAERRRLIDQEREDARQYANRSGWPAAVGPRGVQLLNLLAHLGLPVSAAAIAKTVGILVGTCRKWLKELMREGWVIGLGPSSAQRFTLGPLALEILKERAKWEASETLGG